MTSKLFFLWLLPFMFCLLAAVKSRVRYASWDTTEDPENLASFLQLFPEKTYWVSNVRWDWCEIKWTPLSFLVLRSFLDSLRSSAISQVGLPGAKSRGDLKHVDVEDSFAILCQQTSQTCQLDFCAQSLISIFTLRPDWSPKLGHHSLLCSHLSLTFIRMRLRLVSCLLWHSPWYNNFSGCWWNCQSWLANNEVIGYRKQI